jgi:hypothetical protein
MLALPHSLFFGDGCLVSSPDNLVAIHAIEMCLYNLMAKDRNKYTNPFNILILCMDQEIDLCYACYI